MLSVFSNEKNKAQNKFYTFKAEFHSFPTIDIVAHKILRCGRAVTCIIRCYFSAREAAANILFE